MAVPPDLHGLSVEEFRQAVRDSGGKASDGPIAGFRAGWAIVPFVGSLGHYWRPSRVADGIVNGKRVQLWRSLCQIDGGTTQQAGALSLGNFARCKNCQRQANKLRLT